MDTGWGARLEILKRDAETYLLAPLRSHGWRATIERAVQPGEYLLIVAERGGVTRRLTFFFSTTQDHAMRVLGGQLPDAIVTHGNPMKVIAHLDGTTPFVSASAFQTILVEWNRASSPGKFAPDDLADMGDGLEGDGEDVRILLSETPIEAIWLRLRQLESVRLSRKLIRQRAAQAGVDLDEAALVSKSEGMAFALRNASDYYNASQTRNVSQRILNLYYGTMAFAFAEMLAAPHGPVTLDEIENSTKKGHGLYTLDGVSSDLQDLVVGVKRSGFFSYWLTTLGVETAWMPADAAKAVEGLAKIPADSWSTLEELFARIPEISDLFIEIFDSPVMWLNPNYDMEADRNGLSFSSAAKTGRTYGVFTDVSGRQTKEDVASYPAPLSEIRRVGAEDTHRRFKAAVDHAPDGSWWDALDMHGSPFVRGAMILPVFRDVSQYRTICFAQLYALSIVVRYRPSVWRRVQEGDLDHMRVLIEAFLSVVERVLPEQFLKSITGNRIYVAQPGSFF